ncbi:hypothetical protein BH20ACT2_BH20ACT2_12030 [soil metagenome]
MVAAAAFPLFDGASFSGLGLGAVVGISREYPELLELINDAGRALIDDIGDDCVGELTAKYPFRRLAEFTISADPINEPVAQAVLADLRMGSEAPTAPVHLWHGQLDQLVPFSAVQVLQQEWCAGGATVQLVSAPTEHLSHVVLGLPGAYAFLAGRFAGLPPPSTCPG